MIRFFIFMFALLLCSTGMAEPVRHTIVLEKGIYKKTLHKWASALNKVSRHGSTTYIVKKDGGADKLHVAGHRDSIVWIPDSTDLSSPFKMIIWFHGHWGFVEDRTFVNRTLKQLDPFTSGDKHKNFILVLPEMPWSVHTKTPTKRNSLLWMKKGDFLSFIQQTEETLSEHLRQTNRHSELGDIDYRIVGHSAGGSTIKRIGMTGDLCELNPSMVVWSDSSYGPWLKLAWDGCLKNNNNIMVKVFVAHGDAPWRRATQFMGQFQGPVSNLQLHVMRKPKWSHKLIGHNVVKLSNIME